MLPFVSCLRLYAFLARRGVPRSYTGKILLVAFWGTHIPLLVLLAYFMTTASLSTETTTRVLLIALAATLGGTGLTLFALQQLLAPIRVTSAGLRGYLEQGVLPQLPTTYSDEAGQLMAGTQNALRQLDQMLRFIADYDRLTALPNRKQFLEKVAQTATVPDGVCAVFVLDLTGMSSVNERCGHRIGDLLLCEVANRLNVQTGEDEVFARIGSDEFALLVCGMDSQAEAQARARQLRCVFEKPFFLEGQVLHITAPVGVALHNERGTPSAEAAKKAWAEGLLRNAELALRNARDETGISFYTVEADARARRRLALEDGLRRALEQNEFRVMYQPQINNATGAIMGAEALLRWQHPQFGIVSPSEFIPIAEETGLIVPIGLQVLETACAQNRAWQKAGLPPVRVAVNLSPRQFCEPDLSEQVGRILRETGLNSQHLELEITESLAMSDTARTAQILERIHALGVSVSLDDFGTGFSSLSHLGRLPLDGLKIDQAFVRGLGDNYQSEAITRGIVALAGSLCLDVIAEGVETSTQRALLSQIGCDRCQGFLFSQPVAAEEFAHLLRAGTKQLAGVGC